MPREKFQTRLPADTAEKVYDHIDEHDISQAEAVRRLVEAGLEAEEATNDNDIQRAHQRGTIYFAILAALLTLNLVATLGVI